MLPAQETIANTKTALLSALKARNLTEINGDPLPDEASNIELGVAVDKNDFEKGWTLLEADAPGPELENDETSKTSGGKKSGGAMSLQSADLRNGQSIAFRFKKPGQEPVKGDGEDIDIDLSAEDPGWDIVIPKFDDEEEMGQQ